MFTSVLLLSGLGVLLVLVIELARSVAEVRKMWGLDVVALQREAQVHPSPPPNFRLEVGDVLVVFGRRDQISRFEKECGESAA